MTADQFRRLALSLPEPPQDPIWGTPIFVSAARSLRRSGYPDETWGMVKLTIEQQSKFVSTAPKVFVPQREPGESWLHERPPQSGHQGLAVAGTDCRVDQLRAGGPRA